MDAFELSQVMGQRQQSQRAYLEFLRVPSMSLGVYFLRADSEDPQRPHQEDEVYYVVSGRGQIRVGTEDRAVAPGTLVFVRAKDEHRFHSITEDLTTLVFFAPAESS